MSTNTTNPLDLPAMAAPAGVVPDFDNPPNQTAMGRGILGVAVVLSTISVLIRLSTTWFVLRKAFVGDFVFLAGFALFITAIAFVYETAADPGLFIHQYQLLVRSLIPFLKNSFFAGLIFGPALALLKASILLEWLRIFTAPGMRNLTFWACHLLMWANLIFYALCVVLLCVQCTPIQFIWDPLIDGGVCRIKMTWTELASSLFNFITDVFIMIIPQRAIWMLNMSKQRKVAVAGVFAVGLLGIIATAVRVNYTAYVTTDTDYSFVFSRVMICGIAEGTCAIIVMCGTTASRGFAALASSRLISSLRKSLTGTAKTQSSSGVNNVGPQFGAPPLPPNDKWQSSDNMVTTVSSTKNQNRHPYTEIDEEHALVPLEHGLSPVSSCIVRSTGFHTLEEYDVTRPVRGYTRQYPWENAPQPS